MNEIKEFDVENIWDNVSFQLNGIYNKGPVVFFNILKQKC